MQLNLPVFNHYNRDMAAVTSHVYISTIPLPLFASILRLQTCAESSIQSYPKYIMADRIGIY